MSIRAVSTRDFYEVVTKTSTRDYILVDFCADWCQPCKKIAPKIEQLARNYDRVTFIQIDADKSPELMDKYGVESIPSFLIFKKGDLHPVVGVRGAYFDKVKRVLDELE